MNKTPILDDFTEKIALERQQENPTNLHHCRNRTMVNLPPGILV